MSCQQSSTLRGAILNTRVPYAYKGDMSSHRRGAVTGTHFNQRIGDYFNQGVGASIRVHFRELSSTAQRTAGPTFLWEGWVL